MSTEPGIYNDEGPQNVVGVGDDPLAHFENKSLKLSFHAAQNATKGRISIPAGRSPIFLMMNNTDYVPGEETIEIRHLNEAGESVFGPKTFPVRKIARPETLIVLEDGTALSVKLPMDRIIEDVMDYRSKLTPKDFDYMEPTVLEAEIVSLEYVREALISKHAECPHPHHDKPTLDENMESEFGAYEVVEAAVIKGKQRSRKLQINDPTTIVAYMDAPSGRVAAAEEQREDRPNYMFMVFMGGNSAVLFASSGQLYEKIQVQAQTFYESPPMGKFKATHAAHTYGHMIEEIDHKIAARDAAPQPVLTEGMDSQPA